MSVAPTDSFSRPSSPCGSSNLRKKGLFKRSQSYNDASRSMQSFATSDDDGQEDFLDDLQQGHGEGRSGLRGGSLAVRGRNFLMRISTRAGGGNHNSGEMAKHPGVAVEENVGVVIRSCFFLVCTSVCSGGREGFFGGGGGQGTGDLHLWIIFCISSQRSNFLLIVKS